MLIDLSYEIYNEMPVYPGDIKVELKNDKTLAADDYCNHNIRMGMHAGTHLDLPAHLIEDEKTIADIPLEKLSGRGKIISAAGEKEISMKDKYRPLIKKGDFVLIHTGSSKKYGSEEYYNEHPVLSEELADFLVEKEIKVLGLDLPSPDKKPHKIHKKLFKNNIFILENLCNLERILDYQHFRVIIFPLKVRAEAAPVRAAAEIKAPAGNLI